MSRIGDANRIFIRFVISCWHVIPMYLGLGEIDAKFRETLILRVAKVNSCRA